MELDFKLITATLEILKESGTYPQKDNCYEVKVRYPDRTGFTAHYMPKPVWHMATSLQVLKKSGSLTDQAIISLIKHFNDYGEWKWYQADYDASMDAAGADL